MVHGIAIKVHAVKRQNGGAYPVAAACCRPRERRAFGVRLRDRFTSLFARFFGESRSGSLWDIDVGDKGGTIIVRVTAPGFEARDLDVKLQGNLLILRACKPIETTGKKRDSGEMSFQELYHCEPILSAIDAARTDASFCDCVLTVVLPKRMKTRATAPSLQVAKLRNQRKQPKSIATRHGGCETHYRNRLSPSWSAASARLLRTTLRNTDAAAKLRGGGHP
jgi:HSP20 family molecular chaperone IbpA